MNLVDRIRVELAQIRGKKVFFLEENLDGTKAQIVARPSNNPNRRCVPVSLMTSIELLRRTQFWRSTRAGKEIDLSKAYIIVYSNPYVEAIEDLYHSYLTEMMPGGILSLGYRQVGCILYLERYPKIILDMPDPLEAA